MVSILVVDDDEMNLKVAKVILEQKKYRVVTVLSAEECLQKLRRESFDLVLLDVDMPIMNGIKTLEYMRKREEFKDIPVMFLTADGDKQTVLEAARLGAVGYVKKPFMPQELLERVAAVINGK